VSVQKVYSVKLVQGRLLLNSIELENRELKLFL